MDGTNVQSIFPFGCRLPQEAPKVDLNLMIVGGNFRVEDVATVWTPSSPWIRSGRILMGQMFCQQIINPHDPEHQGNSKDELGSSIVWALTQKNSDNTVSEN